MMNVSHSQFGVLDNRFLARSVGLLNPPSPFILTGDHLVRETIELLQKRKCGAVLICSKQGFLEGIFTERDVMYKISLNEEATLSRPVRDFMTPNPQTVEMTSPIAYALHMMSHGGYRNIPILDDEKIPVGLISVKDIVDYIAHAVTKDLLDV